MRFVDLIWSNLIGPILQPWQYCIIHDCTFMCNEVVRPHTVLGVGDLAMPSGVSNTIMRRTSKTSGTASVSHYIIW